MFPPEIADSTPADVMVTIWDQDDTVENTEKSLRFASELRGQGFRVTLYPQVDKLGKQLKYAESLGVPFVCILRPDEIRLRDMRSGGEEPLSEAKIVERMRDRVAIK